MGKKLPTKVGIDFSMAVQTTQQIPNFCRARRSWVLSLLLFLAAAALSHSAPCPVKDFWGQGIFPGVISCGQGPDTGSFCFPFPLLPWPFGSVALLPFHPSSRDREQPPLPFPHCCPDCPHEEFWCRDELPAPTGAHLVTFDPLIPKIPKKAALPISVSEASSLRCLAEPGDIHLSSRNLESSSQIYPECGDGGLQHELGP